MDYTDIRAKPITQTSQAVKLELVDSGNEKVWVPRVRLKDEGDSVDDGLLRAPNVMLTVQIETWKCDSEGWI